MFLAQCCKDVEVIAHKSVSWFSACSSRCSVATVTEPENNEINGGNKYKNHVQFLSPGLYKVK